MKKKLIVILLSGLFFLSGCAGQTSSPDGARKETSLRGESVIEFWTTYNTEKILSDYDASNYSKIKQEAAVKVETAKNEEECAQLIMTAKTDISYYDVKLSDLKCGDSVYDKSNVSVYNQKYIAVDEIQNGQGATLPTGNYPDALLPFDVAKKYGENNVKAGKNQGITFVFDIPADTKAGVYTGAFTISYDDKTENIPVEMKVRDVTVSETTHSKTYFGVSATGSLPYGELDSDPALKNLYNEELSKYRLCGGTWYVGSDDPDDWVDLVLNFVCDPKNSTLAVPWKYVQSGAGDTIDETYT
ncbi:MAG: hypothetical protein IJ800_03310, partial [Clostridia bacterium]|nr:hypothetical protein [Clostridia bacterium]